MYRLDPNIQNNASAPIIFLLILFLFMYNDKIAQFLSH